MDAKERAEKIVLATRQDRYAKATVLLEYIAAQIEKAQAEGYERESSQDENAALKVEIDRLKGVVSSYQSFTNGIKKLLDTQSIQK